jgi:outer membrane lipoprotein-sorting protein
MALQFDDYALNTGLDDSLFTPRTSGQAPDPDGER